MEGVSYAAILKNLQSRVNPEELWARIGGIRETRMNDLLFVLKCVAKDTVRLDSAFPEVIGETGSVHDLVPSVEVEILDVDPAVKTEEIAKVVWNCLREEPSSGVKVSLAKRPFRGTRKAFIRM